MLCMNESVSKEFYWHAVFDATFLYFVEAALCLLGLVIRTVLSRLILPALLKHELLLLVCDMHNYYPPMTRIGTRIHISSPY